ncbi:ion transporter [Desulfuromonas sp.]|uniref:ion transporter n=1 Tax=Desulfuromonas sp. TaxID=892 RepID=UPI00342D8496
MAAVVLVSVRDLEERYALYFEAFELFSVVVFSAEYLSRLWSCVTDPRYVRPVAGRLRFAATPMAVVDLLAVMPFYIGLVGIDLRFIRSLRLLRIVRVAKVGRYVKALQLFSKVLGAKREELVLTLGMMLLLLIIASCFMFYVENPVQPEHFSDIPHTMWWAVATFTTVGYGDVYPVTGLGKFLAGIVAILGIGLFALPTGILGAGFVEEMQKRKGRRRCPHCGREIDGA